MVVQKSQISVFTVQNKMSEVSDNDSSNNISFIPSTNQNNEHSILFPPQEEGLHEKIINNSVFRMMLRDLVNELVQARRIQQQEIKREQPKQNIESIVEFISQSLALVAQSQTNKKIMEAQKYFGKLYQTKMKQLEERFQTIAHQKVKQIQKKICQIEENTEKLKYQNIPKSPRGNSSMILKDFNISDQQTKRLELKQKILNYSLPPDCRNPNFNAESLSSLSDINVDMNLEKVNERVKTIEDTIKKQIKELNQKVMLLENKAKQQLDSWAKEIKEQNSLHFQSIWNVITLLQKNFV